MLQCRSRKRYQTSHNHGLYVHVVNMDFFYIFIIMLLFPYKLIMAKTKPGTHAKQNLSYLFLIFFLSKKTRKQIMIKQNKLILICSYLFCDKVIDKCDSLDSQFFCASLAKDLCQSCQSTQLQKLVLCIRKVSQH